MDMFLTQLIADGREKMVASAIDVLLEHNQSEMAQAAVTGRALIPDSPSAQYLMLAAEYSRHASRNKDPANKLWQCVLALAASQRCGMVETNARCWKTITEEFPKLPEQVNEFLLRYVGNVYSASRP
jgi:hypothetical protein